MNTGDPEYVRAVLDERARQLGKPLHSGAREPVFACAILSVAGERYAIGLDLVRAVSKLEHLARVPGAPAFVRGVSAVRGEIIALLDLPALLGHETDGERPQEIVIIGREKDELGIGVREVTLGELRLAELSAPAHGSVTAWITRVSAGGISVVDAAKILDDESLMPRARASSEG